jgi:hypothetical protein
VSDLREDWVRVSVFRNRVEAETARSALTAHGIASHLAGDDGGGVGVPMSLVHQGMEVHVAQSDWALAREVWTCPRMLLFARHQVGSRLRCSE